MDQRVDHDIVTQGAPAPGTVRRAGLSGRVLMLTAVFVTLAQFVIFAPSIANFRDNWLRNRLSAAFTAALVLEGAERDLAPTGLPQQLLDSVGARVIVLKMKGTRRMLAAGQLPEGVAETYDMRDISVWASMRAAFRALVAPYGRIITVRGAAPMGGDFIEVTMDEAPLKRAMRDFSFSIVLRSLVVSALVGALAVLSLNWLVLRPVRRLTSSVVGFAAAPQDAARIIAPSGRADEIGDAEQALARMQRELAGALRRREHLAALGLAVAKINHDLRNMLAAAQLLSDRLAASNDPLAQRLAPKLVNTLDRAIRYARAILAYGKAEDEAPRPRRLMLRAVVADAFDALGAPPAAVALDNEVEEGFALVADEDHLFRILMNLARNAVDALAGASEDQPGRVRVSARRTRDRIEIEVSDNGPGVSAAARERLFGAFTGSTRAGGVGLGLAIAADLVRAHGGEIELATAGEGATFRLVLPDRPV